MADVLVLLRLLLHSQLLVQEDRIHVPRCVLDASYVPALLQTIPLIRPVFELKPVLRLGRVGWCRRRGVVVEQAQVGVAGVHELMISRRGLLLKLTKLLLLGRV